PAADTLGRKATGNSHAPRSRRDASDTAPAVSDRELVGIAPGFGCRVAARLARALHGSSFRGDGAAASGEDRVGLAYTGIRSIAFALCCGHRRAGSYDRTGQF